MFPNRAGGLALIAGVFVLTSGRLAAEDVPNKPHDLPARVAELKAIQADYKTALDLFGKDVRAGKIKATQDGTYTELAEVQRRFAKRARVLIDINPKDEVALDALIFAMRQLVADEGDPKLYDLLLAHHLPSSKLGDVVSRPHASEEFLRTVAARSPHADVRAGASMALAGRLARNGHGDDAQVLCERILKNQELVKLHGPANDLLFEIRHLTVGKVVPEVEGWDLDDKPMKLSEFRGKAVMLVFWATWCGPCMAMLPHERELAERFAGRPFAIVGVTGADFDANIKEAVKKHRITWRSFKDYLAKEKRPISNRWHVGEWPTIFLIAQDGVIRHVVRGNPGDRLDADLEKLVGEAEASQKNGKQDETSLLRVGLPAPPLHLKQLLQAPRDAPRTLQGLKGKAIVVDFWATWCAPCVAAFPHLNRLVDDTRNESIVFIAVTDESAQHVKDFLAKKPLATWIGIDDRRATMTAYRANALPQTVLIDAKGVVRAITHPSSVTADVLKDLVHGKTLALNEPPQASPDGSKTTIDPHGMLDPRKASFLVYIGPPDSWIGSPFKSPTEARINHTSVRMFLQHHHRVTAKRVVVEGDFQDQRLGYHVRVPAGSDLVPDAVLQKSLEAAFSIRATRERREMDALFLKHIGPGKPDKAEGDPRLGEMVWFGDKWTRGEHSPIYGLVVWLEGRTGKLVVDETGLTGVYDWEVKIKSTKLNDVNAALAKLGLSLSAERRPVEVLVVRKAKSP